MGSTLEDTPHNAHDMVLWALLLLGVQHLLDTGASCLRRDAVAADCVLAFPHARVDIDIPQPDEQRTVCRALEPAVDLPAEVQKDKKGTSEVELEESVGVQVGTSDGVQSDVELGDESDEVDEHADV